LFPEWSLNLVAGADIKFAARGSVELRGCQDMGLVRGEPINVSSGVVLVSTNRGVLFEGFSRADTAVSIGGGCRTSPTPIAECPDIRALLKS
jgi:hypothetical protein